MRRISFCLVLFFCGLYLISYPARDFVFERKARLSVDTLKIPTDAGELTERMLPENVYIHLDKPYYLTGEHCWYKAYVFHGADRQPTTLSGILYVDLIDSSGKIVDHQRLKIVNGEAHGDFRLGNLSAKGTYTIRAYTNLMKNFPGQFFHTEVLVTDSEMIGSIFRQNDLSREINIAFYPEGGTVVEGIPCQLAFYATNSEGEGVEVKGRVLDQQNNLVTTISSLHHGLGLIPYTATSGQSYRLVLENGQSFPFPKAAGNGASLAVNNLDANKALVSVSRSMLASQATCYLIGRSGGDIRFRKEIQAPNARMTIEIAKADLPPGVISLELLNETGQLLAKRNIFNDKFERVYINVEKSYDRLKPRDSVSLTVAVTDGQGKPVQTSLSIAISDASFVDQRAAGTDILSYLLFSQRMQTPKPTDWYLEENNRWAMDLLMLTMNDGEIPALLDSKAFFQPEQALSLKGVVVSKHNNKPVSNARLTLMVSSYEFDGVYGTEADSLGRFKIDSVDYGDSTIQVWQVLNENGKPVDASIRLDERSDTPVVNIPQRPVNRHLHIVRKQKDIAAFVKEKDARYKMLAEVKVSQRRRNAAEIGFNTRMIRPTAEDMKYFPSRFISQYANGIALLQEVVMPDGTSLWFTPWGAPVSLVINGWDVLTDGTNINPYFLINSYSTEEIDYIVVKGDIRKGYNIFMKTKQLPPAANKGIVKIMTRGYRTPKSFYHLNYRSMDSAGSTPDYRTTLYWNPRLITDAEGKATIHFYNSDAARQLLLRAECMSDGRPGTLSFLF